MPASGRRRATPPVAIAGDPRRPRAALILADALEASRPVHYLPFLELAAVRPPGRSSPPRSNPSRPELPSLAPDLLHLPTSLVKSILGRNRAAIAGRHCRPLRSSTLSVELPPPVHLRPNRELRKLPHALLLLPVPFPERIPHRRRRFAAAPPRTLRAPRGPSCACLHAPPRAPGPPGLPGREPAPPPRRPSPRRRRLCHGAAAGCPARAPALPRARALHR